MKSIGIVRQLDELGRIVLPMEIRKAYNIEKKDLLEIYVEGNLIILKKYSPCCIFCGSYEIVRKFKEKNICKNCIDEVKK